MLSQQNTTQSTAKRTPWHYNVAPQRALPSITQVWRGHFVGDLPSLYSVRLRLADRWLSSDVPTPQTLATVPSRRFFRASRIQQFHRVLKNDGLAVFTAWDKDPNSLALQLFRVMEALTGEED